MQVELDRGPVRRASATPIISRLICRRWCATTFGLGLAGLSAVLALATYRAQVEAQADAHMHGLFSGYLNACLDKDADPEAPKTLPLYVVEEMVDWVRDQQRDLRWWFWSRPFSARRRWWS